MSISKASPFELLGGEPGVRKLVDRFYDIMESLPDAAGIRAIHPTDLGQSRERLFLFLVGWTGGPQHYTERFGHPRLRARHTPFAIGTTERDEWMLCMSRALDEHDLPDLAREWVRQRLAAVADHMRNRIEE